MKRLLLLSVIIAGIGSAVYAVPEGRTIVNVEGVPLRYAFIPHDELPLIISRSNDIPDRDQTLAFLQERTGELEILAPRGMWRIPRDAGFLVGYYVGGPSALASHLVALSLDEGSAPVEIRWEAAGIGPGGTARIEQWELPEYEEPVLLDGLGGDWSEIETLVRFGAMTPPSRVENSRTGEAVPIAEARFWRVGGTGLRSIQSVLGERWWFLAVNATETIDSATFYHLRLFPDRETASAAGQIVIPVERQSGPVIFRTPSGVVSLVGQYVRRDSFLECAIARETVESMMPSAFQQRWSVDIAASRRDESRREHFTYGTVFLNEIPEN